MAARRPPLYRLGRLLLTVSVAVLAIIVGYLAVAAYSVSQVHIDSGGEVLSAAAQGSEVTVSAGVNVTNGGYLPVSDISLVTVVRFPSGELIGVGRAPPVTIGGMSEATVPVTLEVALNLTTGSGEVSLLTESLTLPATTWINATFGGIAQVEAAASTNVSWGAPFSGLNVTFGTPLPQTNGSVAVPVHIAYSNRAPFDEAGTLRFAAAPAGGQACATGSLPLNVPHNTNLDQSVTVYSSPSCQLAGGTVTITFSGPGLSVELPAESIP